MPRFRITALTTIVLACAAGARGFAQTPSTPLADFAKSWGSIDGYHTKINCYSVKGSQSRVSTFDYTFKKPSSISMQVLSGPGAGNNVTWSGGDSVIAGKGMFTKSFSLTDPMVTSLRGATIVSLSFGAILEHAQQTKGSVTVSQPALDGKQVDLVNVEVADPASDSGLTRESLYLSPASNLPVRVDGYTGSQLVNSCTFSDTTTS